jgi:hypothetical protein
MHTGGSAASALASPKSSTFTPPSGVSAMLAAPQAGAWTNPADETDARQCANAPGGEGTSRVIGSDSDPHARRAPCRPESGRCRWCRGAQCRDAREAPKTFAPTGTNPVTRTGASVSLAHFSSGTRLAPVIAIGLAVGLRLGEALGLQWSSVDLDEGVIRVERALETIGRERSLVALKSKESHRTIHLPEFVRVALVQHRQRQRERRLRRRSPSFRKGKSTRTGFFSYDKTRKKLVLRQFHSEGFVNQYVSESASDGKSLVFVTEANENIPAGWRARETYRVIGPDEFRSRPGR